MIHLQKIPVKKLKLLCETGLVVVSIVCLFLGFTEYSYVMGSESNIVRTNDALNNIIESVPQSEEAAEPVTRSLEQIKKDDARYFQPSTVQEVPFRSTINEEAYRKAKEKAWQDQEG